MSGAESPIVIAWIGAGPGAAMLLERCIARHARDTPGLRIDVHLIDPHRPGGGRIWRREQSPLLKLNSMLVDVAFFTDASCTIEGPVAPGPSLAEWVRAVRAGEIAAPPWIDAELAREIAEIGDQDFPTRRLNNAYLGWAHEESLRRAAPTCTVTWHRDAAVAVEDCAGGGVGGGGGLAAGAGAGAGAGVRPHLVRLASGRTIAADLVVYALGHSGADPSDESRRLADFADRHGLEYVAPAFTADIDLDHLPPGEDVIVRGMGLAAVDLVVLLTSGRGGRFTPRPDGTLAYAPSGREPILHLGSRRGVPYRSKITSRIVGDPVALDYLGPDFHAAVARRTEPLDFARDVWPRIAAELVTGYYRELFTGHPELVSGTWAAFEPRLRAALAGGVRGAGSAGPGAGSGFPSRVNSCGGDGARAGAATAHPSRVCACGGSQAHTDTLAALIAAHVPDPDHRFDLAAFDRPLAYPPTTVRAEAEPDHDAHTQRAAAASARHGDPVHERVIEHIATDLRHRTSQVHSATQALFLTGLYAYVSIAEIAPERWNARSRTRDLPRRWHHTFSYLASGPPGHRLAELIALADAGVVRFLGGEVQLTADEARGAFTATGRAWVSWQPAADRDARADSHVSARTVIDAWLPEASAARSDNPLLRSLIETERVHELTVTDADGVWSTGQIAVAPDGRLPGRPTEFALGPFTANPTAGAFTRPNLDSLPFRVHDRVAGAILAAASAVSTPPLPPAPAAPAAPAAAPPALAERRQKVRS